MSAESLQIVIDAINNASGPIREVMDQIENLENRASRISNVGDRLTDFGKTMTQAVTLPIAAALGAATFAAVNFESQMADLNKAYGFDNGSEEAQQAQEVIMGLSQELRQMPGDVTAIATEAGKLGVQFNQLEDYTRTVTAAAVAFDMSAENAGSSMAILTNVLGYQDAQGRVNLEGLQSLGDAINYFADTGATSESAIVNVLQRAGGATRTFGLANESATSLSAAFLNLGYAPEVVGTAMNSMLPALQNASQQSGKFQDALEQIGLPAQQFEQMVKKDAVGALTTFMDAVEASGDTSIIQRMFGTGSDSAMMTSAIQNLESFKRTLLDVENIPAGSMMETFAKRQETASSSLEGLKASLMRMAISIGSVLLPAMDSIVGALTPMVDGFTAFAEAHPGITKIGVAIAAVVAAVGPLIVGIGMVVSAIGSIAGAIAGVQSFMLLVSAIMAGVAPAAGLAGAVAGIAGAIAAIGVGPILAVVAALAAGAYLVISNWEAVSSFLSGVFANIAAALQPAMQAIMQFAQGFAQGFMTGIQPAVPALMQIGAAIQSMGMSLWQMITAFAQFAMGLTQFTMAALQLTPIGFLISTIANAFTNAGMSASSFGSTVGAALSAVISAIANVAAAAMGLVATFSSVMASIVATVSSIAGQMFAAGVNIVTSIANGIRSAMGTVMSAISEVASAVRGALPFSPPEWGPLSDIMSSGGNIVNSIASGIVPEPLTSAMSSALTPMASMMQPGSGVLPNQANVGINSTGTPSSAPSGSITLTYSPQITMSGAGSETEGNFAQMLREHRDEILRLLQGEQRRKERVAYG